MNTQLHRLVYVHMCMYPGYNSSMSRDEGDTEAADHLYCHEVYEADDHLTCMEELDRLDEDLARKEELENTIHLELACMI